MYKITTLRRLVVFGHSSWYIFIGIVCYDDYYVKNHPPKYFQFHIFPFDWVLGVVTVQLPLYFHPIFSILNIMDLHGTKGVLSYNVSRTYVSNFSSIWWGNPKLLACQAGYRIWALMVVRENNLELIPML